MDAHQRADYVERWARVLESQGETRIGGRIYAHLATADAPYLSLGELAEQLGVSRASVSTNTRRLVLQGMLTRVPVPGSRAEHYAVTVDSSGLLQQVTELTLALRELALEGVALQTDRVTPGTQHLRLMAEVYGRLADALAQVTPRSVPGRRVAR